MRKGQTNEKEQCMVHAGSGTGDLISVPDDPAASRSGSKRVYGDYPFSAYVDFFKDEYYRKIFLRTVKIAVITTFVCMVGGIPTAYFISRCDKKWRGLLLSASIFPMMTNSVIRSFAWINILGSNGIINKAMIAMGTDREADEAFIH